MAALIGTRWVIGAALAIALLTLATNRAAAEKPFIFDIDFAFVDTETYCVPALVHSTGRIIERGLFSGGPLTLIEPLKTEFTNLENGKTVTVVHGGVVTESFEEDGLVITLTGASLIQGHGPPTDAGIFEYIVTFDPVTGEEIDEVIRAVGIHAESFLDALCAALQ